MFAVRNGLNNFLEGERGMPRLKPPFPAEKVIGPTNINNVETYANVAWILSNGGSLLPLWVPYQQRNQVFALAGRLSEADW